MSMSTQDGDQRSTAPKWFVIPRSELLAMMDAYLANQLVQKQRVKDELDRDETEWKSRQDASVMGIGSGFISLKENCQEFMASCDREHDEVKYVRDHLADDAAVRMTAVELLGCRQRFRVFDVNTTEVKLLLNQGDIKGAHERLSNYMLGMPQPKVNSGLRK